MFDIKYAKIGDTLLYRPKDFMGNLISFGESFGLHVNLNEYTHVSQITEIYGDKVRIIEAHIDNTDDNGNKVSGVVEKFLNPKWFEIIDIYRYNFKYTDKLIKDEIEVARSYIGYKYGIADLAIIFMRNVASIIIPFIKRLPSFLDESHRIVCSELRALSALYGGNTILCPKINPHLVSPRDIGRSSLLSKVC